MQSYEQEIAVNAKRVLLWTLVLTASFITVYDFQLIIKLIVKN